MTPEQELEFLLIRLRNVQSWIDGINACAVRDNQFYDGWRTDWEGARYEAQKEFVALETQINTRFLKQPNGTTE